MNSKFKIFISSILMLGLLDLAYAQQTITPKDATKFIGQQKTV
jgi:hypothetical protein